MVSVKCLIVICVFLASFIRLSESLNSYIYLADKYIQEEISIGSFIADISEELDKVDKLKSTTTLNQRLSEQEDSSEHQHYTFLEETSTENAYYLIDSITGRLTSKRYLDRESLCMNKHCMEPCDIIQTLNSSKLNNCKMNLKILLIPSYDIVSLNVIVQDLNDNKPQFRIDLINQSIPENVPIGYKLPIDNAYDPDSGINSIQTYTLSSSETNTFQLIHNQNELALVVKQKLDREKVSQYNLSISACDGGAPSNCGQLRIIVNIIDVNDHNPIFSKEVYTFKVNENIPIGTLIGQVIAYDLDEGLNGQIKYKLIGFNGQTPRLDSKVKDSKALNNYFDLNPDTGVLKLNNAILDYESEQHYSLSVEASDCGAGSLPAYATIELFIQDINDNSPEISVSFFNTLYRNLSRINNQSTQTIYLKENYEPNKFLALVSLVDRDSGENAHLDFKLFVNNQEVKQNNNNQLLAMNILNANSFTINTGLKSNKLFDREQILNLNVSIMSWDYGDKSNIAYFNFMIVLLDENDNAPKFDKQEYDLNIYENNEADKFIYKFNATDLDLNENGQLVYMLEFIDDEKNYVYIEESTGILRAAKTFDRELKETYSFYVIARDSSIDLNKRLWSKVKCNLNILDQNDNKPRIIYNQTNLPYKEYSNKTHLILGIDENIPLNTQLVKFYCNDSDFNNNAKTKFSLQPETLPFKISDDGKLVVVKKLDRESVDSYEMQLVCYDQPNNRFEKLNTSLNLIIRINDVNDNCPRALNASDDYETNLPQKTKFFNKNLLLNDSIDLFSLNYNDFDTGKNAELKFQLQSHVDLFKLEIVENKSVYSVKIQFKTTNLTSVKLGKYLIKIKISDNGYPTCIKTDTLVLMLGSTNEAKTQEILFDLLKQSSNKKKSDEYALNADFVNDQDEENYDEINDDDNDETNSDETVLFKTVQINSTNKSLFSLFKSKQFIILFILILTLVLIALMLSIIGLAYCFKKPSRKTKTISADTLKVKNYREGDDLLNRNSNVSSLPSTEEENVPNDDEDQTEINTLLEQQKIKTLNRYSMMSTEKSNSANSVISNITYLQRDTSSSCSNKQTHYANKRNSTFISNNSSSTSTTSSKPIYEQNLKTSSSFLSTSSSSSITPPYVSYSKQQITEANEYSTNKVI